VIAQPTASGLDVVEGPSPTLADVTHDRAQATQPAAPVVQIWCYGEEPLAGQPVGLPTKIVAHAGEVMDDLDGVTVPDLSLGYQEVSCTVAARIRLRLCATR
jgi:hypothetical protein